MSHPLPPQGSVPPATDTRRSLPLRWCSCRADTSTVGPSIPCPSLPRVWMVITQQVEFLEWTPNFPPRSGGDTGGPTATWAGPLVPPIWWARDNGGYRPPRALHRHRPRLGRTPRPPSWWARAVLRVAAPPRAPHRHRPPPGQDPVSPPAGGPAPMGATVPRGHSIGTDPAWEGLPVPPAGGLGPF